MTTAWPGADAAEGWLPPFDAESPVWESGAAEPPAPPAWSSPLAEWTGPAVAGWTEPESLETAWEDVEADAAGEDPSGQRGLYRRRPPEADEEAGWEAEEGVVSQPIAEALAAREWGRALGTAIQEGWRDEGKLANLVFFARHPELGGRALDPRDPGDARLAREWARIRDAEVWPAIQRAARNDALAVSGALVAAGDRAFWGPTGKRFKALVEWAAGEVGLDPGLLAASLLAETGRSDYQTTAKVSSYLIGTDDFYERRHALRAKVPAYAKVGWDRNQTPETHANDALKPRDVKTIRFDSGRDALLASAVNLKYGEVVLREAAAKRGADLDRLPVETRFALTRIAFAAGPGGARKYLDQVLDGQDILVRNDAPLKPRQTRRNATIRAAQALHLSDWVFGAGARPAAPQPELEEPEAAEPEDEESFEFENLSWDPAAEPPAPEVAEHWSGELAHPLGDQLLGAFYEQELKQQAALAEPATAVERLSGPEHRDIGDLAAGREPTTIAYGLGGDVLGFGEVVALAGDYFGTYDEMAELARWEDGRNELAWARWSALELPKDQEPHVPQAIKDAVRNRYYLLASRNVSHFSAGGSAWPAYVTCHSRAIADALQAGQSGDARVWRRALTIEAFGDHFLSDMFSGGHVRTPRAAIREWYQRRFPDSVERFIRYVARFIYDRLDERQLIPPLAWWFSWVTRSRIEQRIGALGGEAVNSFSLGDIVSLALHDHDNNGLRVVSQVGPDGRPVAGGHRWKAMGDAKLGTNKAGGDTSAMAVAAVIASLRDLERVRGVGTQLAGGQPSAAERLAAIRRALGGQLTFAAKPFVPVEDRTPGANVPLPGGDGAPSPLEWRWGQLGDVAYCAVDDTVKVRLANALFERLRDVQEPTEAGGLRIWGARHAFRLFTEHLRREGIRALELAIDAKAR
jgi:hypothetical protein